MKKAFAWALCLAILGLFAASGSKGASAAAISVGNDPNSRSQVDSYKNFVVLDTNHPIQADGHLTGFSYYATSTSPFRFLLVDGNNVVKWMSDQITPPQLGANNFTPAAQIGVKQGWDLGVYFTATSSIPFEVSGASAFYTDNNSGQPSADNTLNFVGSSSRTYSFGATGTATQPDNNGNTNPPPATGKKTISAAMGWIRYTAGNLNRQANFFAAQRIANGTSTGYGFFKYSDADHNWYKAKINYVKISENDIYLAGPVTAASQSAWMNNWIYVKIRQNKKGHAGQIWGSFVDSATAISRFNNNDLTDPSDGPFKTKGNIKILKKTHKNHWNCWR